MQPICNIPVDMKTEVKKKKKSVIHKKSLIICDISSIMS